MGRPGPVDWHVFARLSGLMRDRMAAGNCVLCGRPRNPGQRVVCGAYPGEKLVIPPCPAGPRDPGDMSALDPQAIGDDFVVPRYRMQVPRGGKIPCSFCGRPVGLMERSHSVGPTWPIEITTGRCCRDRTPDGELDQGYQARMTGLDAASPRGSIDDQAEG